MKFKHLIVLCVLVAVATSSTTAHKFYMSITQLNYIEKEEAIQITTRLFIDDIEDALNERYSIDAKLQTKKEIKNLDFYLEKYMKHHFTLKVNNDAVQYSLLGHAYEDDVIKCYVEIKDIPSSSLHTIFVQNTLLFDMFPEQQNLIHMDVKGPIKSFILTRGNDKAVLKL